MALSGQEQDFNWGQGFELKSHQRQASLKIEEGQRELVPLKTQARNLTTQLIVFTVWPPTHSGPHSWTIFALQPPTHDGAQQKTKI